MQRRAFTLGAAALAVAGTMSLSMNVAMAKDIAMTADVVVIGAGNRAHKYLEYARRFGSGGNGGEGHHP